MCDSEVNLDYFFYDEDCYWYDNWGQQTTRVTVMFFVSFDFDTNWHEPISFVGGDCPFGFESSLVNDMDQLIECSFVLDPTGPEWQDFDVTYTFRHDTNAICSKSYTFSFQMCPDTVVGIDENPPDYQCPEVNISNKTTNSSYTEVELSISSPNYTISSSTVDFGDGSTPVQFTSQSGISHQYDNSSTNTYDIDVQFQSNYAPSCSQTQTVTIEKPWVCDSAFLALVTTSVIATVLFMAMNVNNSSSATPSIALPIAAIVAALVTAFFSAQGVESCGRCKLWKSIFAGVFVALIFVLVWGYVFSIPIAGPLSIVVPLLFAVLALRVRYCELRHASTTKYR